jgi:hypothetical protein
LGWGGAKQSLLDIYRSNLKIIFLVDPAWPTISTVEEFTALPEAIQQKVTELLNSDVAETEQNTFIENYNNVADPLWPKISTVEEFYALSKEIQQEVIETFNITPPQ